MAICLGNVLLKLSNAISCNKKQDLKLLKFVSAIFYEILILSPNDNPSKIIKNVFYFNKKALFVLEIFKFL